MKTYVLTALVLAACVDDPEFSDDLGEETSEVGTAISYTATDVPKAIPDNNATGATSTITSYVDSFTSITVDVNVSHTFRGDLVITLRAPSGQTATLSNRAGGPADNYVATNLNVMSTFANASPHGVWSLKVVDQAAQDVGTINAFKLTFGGATATPPPPPELPKAIPDATSSGWGTASTTFTSTLQGGITDIRLDATIAHANRGDLEVELSSPSAGKTVTLAQAGSGGSGGIVISGLDLWSEFGGFSAAGTWTLTVHDTRSGNTGSITAFKLTMTASPPPIPVPTFVGYAWRDSDFQQRAIPDINPNGIAATMNDYVTSTVGTVQVRLDIAHTYRGDLHVTLTSPAGETVNVVTIPSTDYNDNIIGTFDVTGFTPGSPEFGPWTLKVWDSQYGDIGTLRSWSIGVNTFAPQ